MTSASTLVFLL